jgi:hypothetical protein
LRCVRKCLLVPCWLAGVVKLRLFEGGSLYLFESLVLLCICRLSVPVAGLLVLLFSIVDFDVFSVNVHDALN